MALKNKTMISATFSDDELEQLNKASKDFSTPKTRIIRDAVAVYIKKLYKAKK